MASAYYDANRSTYVIADKGTVTGADWLNNAEQGLGLQSQQYQDANKIAVAVNQSDAGQAGQVEYTGHSLGGGMASLQALVGGAPAITFNSSGLNSITAARYGVDISEPNHIDAYYVSGDPLNFIQDHTPLPSALGYRIPLIADNPVLITSNGLIHSTPMSGLQTVINSADANLHFMGASESSIYNNFPVFSLLKP